MDGSWKSQRAHPPGELSNHSARDSDLLGASTLQFEWSGPNCGIQAGHSNSNHNGQPVGSDAFHDGMDLVLETVVNAARSPGPLGCREQDAARRLRQPGRLVRAGG